jgi:hypothetical protein
VRADANSTQLFNSIFIYANAHLYAEVAPVYVVAEEEVLCGCRGTAHFKEFHQVIELTVDVSADCKKTRKT